MAKNITKLKHRFPFREIRKVPKFFVINWPVFAILIFSTVTCYLNFSPNTYLSGWDNLHPEFALTVNLKRALFSVWQEFQSLGLLGGMAHAADLPKVFIFWCLSFLNFPLQYYRYGWTFLMLILGPLGVYFFLDTYLLKNRFDSMATKIAGFLGALYYLLNLSTLQSFFTPFDTFTSFYGFFPWIIFFVIRHLVKPSLKNTVILFTISLLATPSFYTETMFVVLGFCLLPFLIEEIFSHKRIFPEVISGLKTIIILLIPNLFWLLPVAFFVITNGSVGEMAKINTIATPETYSRNLQFGDIKDLSILKGFWFNYLDNTGNGNYDYLLRVWRVHLDTFSVTVIGYLLFGVVIAGLYYALKKRLIFFRSILSIQLICYFFLMGGGLLINQRLPLIGELFRSPFTKFSISLSFAYACFFAVGTIFLLDLFTFLHSRFTYLITVFTISLFLIIFMSPVFAGQLIAPTMRVQIPDDYFQLFSFFKDQDQATRIANFPQADFWGWLYYDWGYRGSGFLWYGIKQPILDRAFDVWDKSSEHYYEEINAALYSNDFGLYDKLIQKYSVNYVLIDAHVVAADDRIDLHDQTLKKWLDSSPNYTLVKNINDYIFVYKTNVGQTTKNFISVSPINSFIEPFNPVNLRPNQNYDLRSDQIKLPTMDFEKTKDYQLELPSPTQKENLLPVNVSYQKTPGTLTFKFDPVLPTIMLNGKDISQKSQPTFVYVPVTESDQELVLQIDNQYYELQLPAEIENFSYFPLVSLYLPTQKPYTVKIFDGSFDKELDLTNSLKVATPYQCFTDKANRKIEKIVTQTGISLYGTDVVGCLSTPLPAFSTDGVMSYSFTYSSPTNTPANASITDLNLGATDITQPLVPQTTPKRVRLFSSITLNPQKFNLILEANQTKSVQEIDYQDIRLFFHPLIFQTQNSINPAAAKSQALTQDTNQLTVSSPLIDSSYDILQDKDHNQLFPESRNCDQFNKGIFTKKISDNGFTYESQNAISCDYLDLRQLPHSLNYLLTFDYHYQTGLPMVICLENQTTNRCDVYERLQKNFTSQSIVQPIANPEEFPGYTLHLFDQSIGSQRSISSIKSFSIHPIPLNYLKSIKLEKENSQPVQISTFTSTHLAEFVYTFSSRQQGVNLLNLYQTRSSYWKAIQVPSDVLKQSLFTQILRLPVLYLTQPKLASYYTDTQWFNSWILPSGDHSYIIVYLPQYLEFAGLGCLAIFFLALVVTSLIVITKKTKKRLSKKKDAQTN